MPTPTYFIGTLSVLLALLAAAPLAQAQVQEVPVEQIPQQTRRYEQTRLLRSYGPLLSRGTGTNSTTADLLLLNIPFFDDFSTTTVKPDSLKWYSQSGQYGTYINNVFGGNPPSVGVASFDGIAANGFAYNANERAVGLADTLTSQGFRLAGKDTTNLYLSFFLMPGNREAESRPDTADSLVVQFLLPSGAYQTVAKYKGGQEPQYRFRAVQIGRRHCFDGFRFKFQSYGRLNGAFDLWNLDYVRLDYRAATDSSARDLAVSGQPGPLFGRYRSIPLDHAKAGPPSLGDSTTGAITNLNNAMINFNLEFHAREYRNGQRGRELHYVPTGEHNIIGTGGPLNPGETRKVRLNPGRGIPFNVPADAEPMDFTSEFSFVRDPSFNDVASNDTARTVSSLRDFYAYDDGGHEKAFLLVGNGARILYRFDPLVADTLVGVTFGIDTRTFNTNTFVPFNILLYRKVKGVDGATNDTITLFDSGVLGAFSSQQTNLVYRPLSRMVPVNGTYYFGFQQGVGVESSIYIQADINSTVDNAFYISTTPGIWDLYRNSRSALIIRPHYKCKTCPVSVRKPLATLAFDVFPNPNRGQGRLRIDGKVEAAQLIGLDGRVLAEYAAERGQTMTEVTLPEGIRPGIYLLKGTGKAGAFGTRRLRVE